MSRSAKRTPIGGVGSSKGQKRFRSKENKAKRRKVNQLLTTGSDNMPHEREYGNECASPRDGKTWWGNGHTLYCKSMTTLCEGNTCDCDKYYRKWMGK